MTRKRTVAMLLAIPAFIAACSDDPAPSQATPDGGVGSDGGAVSPDSVCRDACANIARCRSEATTDKAACTAQCVKELAGEGFLAPDVATIVFQSLTPSLDAECFPTWLDERCLAKSFEDKCRALSGSTDGWGFGVFPTHADVPGGENYDRLASKAKIAACAQREAELCPGASDPELLQPCFVRIYRYRPSTVALLEPCLAQSYDGAFNKCFDLSTCLRETLDIKGQPWLGPDFAQ